MDVKFKTGTLGVEPQSRPNIEPGTIHFANIGDNNGCIFYDAVDGKRYLMGNCFETILEMESNLEVKQEVGTSCFLNNVIPNYFLITCIANGQEFISIIPNHQFIAFGDEYTFTIAYPIPNAIDVTTKWETRIGAFQLWADTNIAFKWITASQMEFTNIELKNIVAVYGGIR